MYFRKSCRTAGCFPEPPTRHPNLNSEPTSEIPVSTFRESHATRSSCHSGFGRVTANGKNPPELRTDNHKSADTRHGYFPPFRGQTQAFREYRAFAGSGLFSAKYKEKLSKGRVPPPLDHNQIHIITIIEGKKFKSIITGVIWRVVSM